MKLPYLPREISPPKRPYKNLMEYRAYRVKGHTIPDGDWPCLRCGAKGWIYDPDDPPCPIEGYKMVDRIKCPECKGAKTGPRSACTDAYKAVIVDYEQKKARFYATVKTYTEAVSLLTDEQVSALRTVWSSYWP